MAGGVSGFAGGLSKVIFSTLFFERKNAEFFKGIWPEQDMMQGRSLPRHCMFQTFGTVPQDAMQICSLQAWLGVVEECRWCPVVPRLQECVGCQRQGLQALQQLSATMCFFKQN